MLYQWYMKVKIVDVWCPRIPGNCFEEVIVVGKSAYEELIPAINQDKQDIFLRIIIILLFMVLMKTLIYRML